MPSAGQALQALGNFPLRKGMERLRGTVGDGTAAIFLDANDFLINATNAIGQ